MSYGDDDNADRQNLCRHYWIFCNSGEYNYSASVRFVKKGDLAMCSDDTKIYVPSEPVPVSIPENETDDVRIFSGKSTPEG